MTKSLPFALLCAGALISGTAAIAQTQTHAATAAKTTTTTTAKPSMFQRMKATLAGKPAASAAPVAATKTTTVRRTAAATPNGRMVTTKTSTGKTITYNCSKAGNANKKACKA